MEKEEVKKNLAADDAASDTDELQPVFKQHVLSVTLKDSFKKASDEDWKKLCIENFDFVRIALESNKDKKMNAAKLAKYHDREEETMFRQDVTIVKRE